LSSFNYYYVSITFYLFSNRNLSAYISFSNLNSSFNFINPLSGSYPTLYIKNNKESGNYVIQMVFSANSITSLPLRYPSIENELFASHA